MSYSSPSIRVRLILAAIPLMILSACGGSSTDNAPDVSTDAVPSTILATTTVYNRPRPTLPIPAPMVGVTLDDISNLSATITSLKSINKVPTTRIVFDEFMPASYYRDATSRIRNVSYVMGEILDSYYVRQYSVQAYLDRTKEYLTALADVVDIWEVGNEINGEWLGNTSDVVAKMSGAYDLVKAQGKIAELTLYYNKDCWSKPSNEMFTWAQNNIPTRMKQGLDYVLVSYYEDDCNGLQPNWPEVFTRLRAMFPNSKIGFGEVGTTNKAKKAEYITRYYSKQINVPNYVGGYFWWYFKKDMVPNTQPLLATLNNAISGVPATTTTTVDDVPTDTTTSKGTVIPLTSNYWTTVYNGYGSVTYDAKTGIVLSPKAALSPSTTHAALTLANHVQP